MATPLLLANPLPQIFKHCNMPGFCKSVMADLNNFVFEICLCLKTQFYHVASFLVLMLVVHSRSKCLVWVKKCCHIWLDQNFDPSLLTNKLWLVFMRKKQKKKNYFEKKIQNGRLKKTMFFKIANSQKIFAKISQIGPWVSRIDWCKGHWCGSTYMAVRLSDIFSKRA